MRIDFALCSPALARRAADARTDRQDAVRRHAV
jgi:exonuclease III